MKRKEEARMGESIILGLLLLARKTLNTAIEKGIAVSVAAVQRDGKFFFKGKVTDWDSRPECLKDKGSDDEKE